MTATQTYTAPRLSAAVPASTGRHARPYSEEREHHTQPDEWTRPARHRADEQAPPVTADAREGYYTRSGDTFRVQLNKAGTHTYAKQLRSYGSRLVWEYAPGVGRDLARDGLAPLTAEEAGRLGLAHGQCIHCLKELGGKSLSAQVSATIGYGETCASNNGWTYPKGRAAQREYLAAHGVTPASEGGKA